MITSKTGGGVKGGFRHITELIGKEKGGSALSLKNKITLTQSKKISPLQITQNTRSADEYLQLGDQKKMLETKHDWGKINRIYFAGLFP